MTNASSEKMLTKTLYHEKTLLFTIAALITAWSAIASEPLPDKDWEPIEGPVTYSATDVINIHIAGTGDKEYDRLVLSSGALTPGGATLNVFPCYATHPIGHRFVIFKAPAINGKFSNPPLIDAGGNFFVSSYENENNSDLVVLTAVTKLFGLYINTSDSPLVMPYYNYTLNVVADPPAGGNVVPAQATFKVCGEIGIEVTDNVGYAFTHWTQQGGAIIANTASPTTTATMPARDVTITAHFCELPPAPTAQAASGITTNTFTAHWEAVSGAVTYTLQVALDEDFSNFVTGYESYEAVGTTSHTVVGLVSNTTYHYRVKATDACGTSKYSNTVIVTTAASMAFPCPASITFTYRGASVTYGVIERGGLCWMDRNLGASRVPESRTDSEGFGDLFQWGRSDDGHQLRNSGQTAGPTGDANPGSNFITVDSGNWYNGTDPDPDDLWQDDGTSINNPCPASWRVPTIAELVAERNSWDSYNRVGAYSSTLKWPTSGHRAHHTGKVWHEGNEGGVWSSSVYDIFEGRSLYFISNNAYQTRNPRAFGRSVRCVRDLPDCEFPPAPNATEATGITTSTFTAHWDPVPGAVNYTLDVALDEDFNDFVDGYEDLDVGDVTSHIVDGLDPSTTYYYRVKVTDDCGESDYSDAVSVTTEAATTELKIGDSHQGGIIAYILQPGDPGYIEGEVHGLIAAPTDQSTSAQWGCGGTSIGGTSTALGTGAANTTAILECTTAGIAAHLCNDLELNGYTDWYLPSKDELNKLYINREAIGGLAGDNYWSSSENSSDTAWIQDCHDGIQSENLKNTNARVRAVRAF